MCSPASCPWTALRRGQLELDARAPRRLDEPLHHDLSLVESMIFQFVLGRRHVADRFEQPPIVEPVNPFERRVLHRIVSSPRPATVDHLSLVEPDDGLGEGVVVGVAHTADLGDPLAVADRQVLTAAVAVVAEPVAGPSSGSAPRTNWPLSR